MWLHFSYSNPLHVPLIPSLPKVKKDFQKYGTDAYLNIVELKSYIVAGFLETSTDVLLVDADTVFLSSPFPDLTGTFNPDHLIGELDIRRMRNRRNEKGNKAEQLFPMFVYAEESSVKMKVEPSSAYLLLRSASSLLFRCSTPHLFILLFLLTF
jgi:hypothetical protein